MAYGTGQVAGIFSPYHELMTNVRAQSNQKALYLAKIGIQMEKANRVFLNDEEFEIGKTGKLEFDNIEITSIKPANRLEGKYEDLVTPVSIILDYVYVDNKE